MGKRKGGQTLKVLFSVQSTVSRDKNTSLNTNYCFNTILISKRFTFFLSPLVFKFATLHPEIS